MNEQSVFNIDGTIEQDFALRRLAREGLKGLPELEKLIKELTAGKPEIVTKACKMMSLNRCMCNELFSIFRAIDGPRGSQGNRLTAEGEELLADLEPLQEAMRKGIEAIKKKHRWIGEWNV